MGIREKLHLFKNKDNAEENSSKEAARKCVLKVQDKFRLRNTDDIVVVGELKGKIQVGDMRLWIQEKRTRTEKRLQSVNLYRST